VKLVAVTRLLTDMIYWVNSVVLTGSELTAHKSVHRDDYDLWHRQLGHPGKQVFEKFESSTRNFPKSIEIPKSPPVCEGCAKGKMHSRSFPDNSARATHPFQWIHSDLKEFAVQSYHHHKYYISFIDDNSSHSWIALLKKKSDSFQASKQFIAMVKNQYNATVSEWMTDNGGEYVDEKYIKFLKDEGIEIKRSVPSQPQMNGRAEHFNRTIDEKAETMRHQACLPDSWWEFSILHANYLYNRTPVKRLNWQTPKGYLDKVQPDLSHLCILGCGAYVFIHKDLRVNKLSPKSELMTFLGYRDGHESNMMFMRPPNNVIFTAATALFDERLFPRCPGHKVPPVTQIQEPEEPEIEIETESVLDEDAPFDPPPSLIPQVDDGSLHDDAEHQHPPQSQPPPRDAPGGAQRGEDPPRRSERERKSTRKDGIVYPPGTSTDTDRRRKLPDANTSATSVPNSGQSSNSVEGDPGHAKLAMEGGALWEYLLTKAISHDELPDPMNVRDWTSKDIDRLPVDDRREWRNAQFEELEALKKRDVYELSDLPPGHKAIRNRWVFDLKSDGCKKARLVAKGFSQIEGLDFDEIFSPVVRFESVRTIIALAALEKWKIEALDVKSAFLYGTLDEELYMEQPQGFKVPGKEHKVLRLRKAIYGLKQAAHAWWHELDKSLKALGFSHLYADAGIFVAKHADGTMAIILVYVDDIIVTGPNTTLVASKKKLFMDKWECRDLGECKEFLRMRIDYRDWKTYIDQVPYLEKFLKRFGMADAKAAQTPLPTGYKPEPSDGTATAALRSQYQSVIGSLLYLMLGTCPDLAFAVTQMAKFAHNPSEEHLVKAKHIMRYLAGTHKYALVFDGRSDRGLYAYCDSSYGDDRSDADRRRRSTQGYYFSLANGCVKWHSKTQTLISTSSTMAEYIALSDCARDCAWYKTLFGELGKPIPYVPIYGDSHGVIFNAQNPVTQKGIKHIEIRYHYIREQIEKGNIKVFAVPTVENVADMFTKNLGPTLFLKHRKELGIGFYPL